MKDAIHHSADDILNIKMNGKAHVLFGGTRLLQIGGAGGAVEVLDREERESEGVPEQEEQEGIEEVSETDLPPPPDKGCVVFALRTGFSSSQGKLVRMIERSTENVRSDTRYISNIANPLPAR